MKILYTIIWVLIIITGALYACYFIADYKEARKIEIMNANNYIYDKYTPKEIKDKNDQKVNEYITRNLIEN